MGKIESVSAPMRPAPVGGCVGCRSLEKMIERMSANFDRKNDQVARLKKALAAAVEALM